MVRGTAPQIDGGCASQIVLTDEFEVTVDPAAGEVWYFLARAYLPNTGSWGVDSSGGIRRVLCVP